VYGPNVRASREANLRDQNRKNARAVPSAILIVRKRANRRPPNLTAIRGARQVADGRRRQ